MKVYKPRFWSNINLISTLFLPISLIINFINIYKRRLSKPRSFGIPIICVGNIYVGGTGKTPTSIFLAKELNKLKKKPVIIRKFYENYEDEHNLIRQNFPDLILGKTRKDAIQQAKDRGFKSIILDDGYQDFKIKKNLNILCFNENQLIGNGLVIPSGPLRESLYSLKYAEIILINGKRNLDFERKILKINKNLQVFYSKYKLVFPYVCKNKNILAFAGIGNPENFFKLLLSNGFNIKRKINYPDHYKYKRKELEDIISEAQEKNLEIVTTEKDFYRIKKYKLNKINYIKIEIEISNKDDFLRNILDIYD